MADYLMNSLPEFCLNHSELSRFDHETGVALMRRAAQRVYETKKFTNRGEFGELLLHVLLRQVFNTLPAISKIFYKDAANDTVKGFDAVHVVVAGDALQLWLGEVKFYEDIGDAMRAAVSELKRHCEPDYMRGEFIAVRNKLDPAWPHAERLALLLHESVTLDKIFSLTCVPVLLTYDSDATRSFTKDCAEYRKTIQAEVSAIYDKFAVSDLPKELTIHLLLMPLSTKKQLLEILDTKMRAWQTI
jgi:hypothetical protein